MASPSRSEATSVRTDYYSSCPCCGSAASLTDAVVNEVPVRKCGCGALLGTLPKADQYRLVKPEFAAVEPPVSRLGYFDFTTPDGKDRFHGWYDTQDGRIVQVG